MIGKRKLSEVRRELEELLKGLPPEPEVWFDREIESIEPDERRDAETLRMLHAALQQAVDEKKASRSRS